MAPYGYVNMDDRDEPIQLHSERSQAVIRIFEIYSRGNATFRQLADRLEQEGYVYRPSQRRFAPTALSYILNNRFYIGEITWRGRGFPGKHRQLVSRALFDACQDVLHGRNRRVSHPVIPLAGGLLRCAYCGSAITGECIRRRQRGGLVKEHVYYRCANNDPPPGHPKVRWRAADLDAAAVADLATLRLNAADVRSLVHKTIAAMFADYSARKAQQTTQFTRRMSELQSMQERLLNAYVAGTIDEPTLRAKSDALKGDMARVTEALEEVHRLDPGDIERAMARFDFGQDVEDIWRGSNSAGRRAILDAVSLNRLLTDVTLVTTKRKPFDIFAERPFFQTSRGDWI